MYLAVLVAASAVHTDVRATADYRGRVLFAVNEEAAAPPDKADAFSEARDSKIEHTPVEKSPRGRVVAIKAKVTDPSRLFHPLVFARKTGTSRYEAFTMRDKGKNVFNATLPASIMSEGSFEYFIEAQHQESGATRFGSPRKPFNCFAYDPPPEPVAIKLITDEPGAAVKIDDNEIGKTPLVVNLLPGRHAIGVTAADGRSAEQQIDVKPGNKKMDLRVEMPRQAGGPATLSVQGDPPNANVLVDGALVGRTPFQGELNPGEHLVAVEMDGRMREERKLFVREGRDANVSYSLAPLPKDPALIVESEPVGAQVIIDGKERGRTPFLAPVAAGRHQLVLKMEGHREVGTDFTMPRDRDYTVRLDLPAGSGTGSRLTLTSVPSSAAISVDGREVGITPWSAEMRPGNHKIQVSAKGYAKEDRVVQVQPNRDADVTFALNREPGPGKLHIETEPAEAVVSLDGKRLGTSPLTADVAPGDHQMEATLEGFKTIGQELSLDPGQQLSLKLAMQPSQSGQVPPLIAVASDPQGAQLYLDGRQIGPTPIKVRSKPGAHEIKLVLDGYMTRTARPVLPDTRDFELRMAISLRPVRGVEEKHQAPSALELARAQIATAHSCSKQGDYECGLKGYQKAYEYKPDPRILFNIASMRRHMGQFTEAASAYQNFLKEVPKGQDDRLREEAQKQLALCELKLKPAAGTTAAAVATSAGTTVPKTAIPTPQQEEEDTDPPILTHQAVKRAYRGHPVRLTARVVDERSGVATPQACWRNLYKKDFECQPMGKIGEDQYGIEVPAKAVNDGFAYYLEAYDNNDNGPARSGAPELPNSVMVEDAPRPALAAVTTEAVKVAPTPASTAAPVHALPVAEHELPPPPQRKSHLASYIAAGGAVAAVLAAGALTLHANSATDDLRQNSYPADQRTIIQSRIDNDRTITKVLLGVGGAFVIGTVALWNF